MIQIRLTSQPTNSYIQYDTPTKELVARILELYYYANRYCTVDYRLIKKNQIQKFKTFIFFLCLSALSQDLRFNRWVEVL
jgi:hypothetical protein